MARQSTITKSDIHYLIRLMSAAELTLVKYGLDGCRKTGFSDDMMACVDLIHVRDAINRVLEESKKTNSFGE